jgi:hypothetical protein
VPAVTLNRFLGIAPNRTAFTGQALIAENVDLSGGGLKPIKSPSFVESGHYGEIANYMDTWISGGKNYLISDVRGLPVAIYKNDAEIWKLRINGAAATNLWIDAPENLSVQGAELLPPATPRLTSLGSGSILAGTYEYFVTFTEKDANGAVLRESDSCAAVELLVEEESQIRISRPPLRGVPSPYMEWNVYRRVKGNTLASRIGSAGIYNTAITDNSDGSDLGDTIIPESRDTNAYDYRYVAVWVRNVEGWITESTPSEIYSVSQSSEGVTFSIEGVTVPELVTHWRLYRISLGTEATTTFQLVEELPIATQNYTDVKDNIELGAALATSYRADNGALVSAGIPAQQFDGMAGPFNGFYVGWIGRDLYLSEPGNPSWWPGAYVVEANFDISSISQVGGNIAVITKGGVQFGYGVSPDAFSLSQSVFGSGGIGRGNSDQNYYLGYNGIYQISEGGATLVSTNFDKDYFDPMNTEDSFMIIEKEKLFLFHDQGALVYDFVSQQWSTLAARDHSFTAVHEIGGNVFGLRDGSIVKLFGGDEDATMVYKGVTSFNEADTKRVEALRFHGTGQCLVTISSSEDPDTDDTVGEVDMNTGYEPDRISYPPAWLSTEAVSYKIAGKATVRSIMFTVEQANTET